MVLSADECRWTQINSRKGSDYSSQWPANPRLPPWPFHPRPKKKPARAGPGGRLGAGFLNPGRRCDRLGFRQLSLLGEGILAERQLLVRQGQLAAGRGNQLGINGTVNRRAEETHGSVTEREVGAVGVAAGNERVSPLECQGLAEVDVFVENAKTVAEALKTVEEAIHRTQETTKLVLDFSKDLSGRSGELNAVVDTLFRAASGHGAEFKEFTVLK